MTAIPPAWVPFCVIVRPPLSSSRHPTVPSKPVPTPATVKVSATRSCGAGWRIWTLRASVTTKSVDRPK